MRLWGRLLAAAAILVAIATWGQRAAHSDEPTGRQIADLIDELRDQDAHVREVAHRELVRLGGTTAPALVAAVRGSDANLGDEALSVLSDIGPGAKAVAPKLVEFALSADSDRFRDVTRVVARIDPSAARPLVKRLVELLNGADMREQTESLETMAVLGDVARDASPAILARLGTASPLVRESMLRTLSAIGTDPSDYILDLWTTSRDSVANWAPASLITIGKPAVEAAARRLKSDDKNSRVAAATALGAMGPAARDVVPGLLLALKDETGAVRRAAAESLGLIGSDAQIALPALTEGVQNATLRIQREAAVAIGQIGVAAARPSEVADATGQFRGRDLGQGRSGGATKQTETSVMWALRWLKNHQSPEGLWDSDGFDARCKLNRCDGRGESAYDPGLSGLALLCFLGAGETHQSGTCRDTVANGLKYLRRIQDSEGCFGPRTSQHFLYNHACAALAMTEAYGMTGSRTLRESAESGVGFVLKAKNPYLAWRYNCPPDGDNDTSVTGWMMMVLKSAVMSKLDVDKSAIKGAVSWVEKMTDPEYGRTGYQQRGGPPARTNEMMIKFPSEKSEALTGVGVLVRIFGGHTPVDDRFIMKGANLMAQKLPKWDVDSGTIDFYYWYYGALAMFQVGGDHWKRWNDAMKTAIVDHQRMQADRDERGSWDPVDCWSPEGGRIYATALNCLSMEVYYRYGRFLEVPDNSARPLPDTRPVMSATLRDAVGALTDALKSDDTEVCAVAETALNQLRAVYRTSTTPPDAPEEPKFAPESGPKFEPRALTKTAGNSAAYWAWIDKFAYACEYGDDEEVAELWTGGTKTTWVFPATVQEIRDGRVWARIDSERTYVYRFVWVRDSLGNVTKERRRWGFGPENHEFRVPEGLLGTLRVGTSVEVTIDLDPNGAKDARNGEFSAQLNIWRPSGR